MRYARIGVLHHGERAHAAELSFFIRLTRSHSRNSRPDAESFARLRDHRLFVLQRESRNRSIGYVEVLELIFTEWRCGTGEQLKILVDVAILRRDAIHSENSPSDGVVALILCCAHFFLRVFAHLRHAHAIHGELRLYNGNLVVGDEVENLIEHGFRFPVIPTDEAILFLSVVPVEIRLVNVPLRVDALLGGGDAFLLVLALLDFRWPVAVRLAENRFDFLLAVEPFEYALLQLSFAECQAPRDEVGVL